MKNKILYTLLCGLLHSLSANAQSTIINYSDCMTVTTTLSSQVVVYSLPNVTKGDSIIINVSSPIFFDPCVTVYFGANFIAEKCANSYLASLVIHADTSGTYTITVQDFGNNDTGTFSIFVERANMPAGAQPITCGIPDAFQIDCEPEMVVRKFSAQPNSFININASSPIFVDVCLVVRNAAGLIVASDCMSQASANIQFTSSSVSECYYIFISDYASNDAGDVNMTVSAITGGCDTTCSSSTPLEICNNGLDDNGNNLTDCADPYCGTPSIQTVTAVNPTNCPILNNGSIGITASMSSGVGGQLLYSINGGTAYQASSFPGLMPGIYSVLVSNSVSGCTANYSNNPVTLTATACPEICDNGLDDDGNSLTDCADPHCGTPSIQTVTAANPTNCPIPNNGSIGIAASMSGGVGGQLLYSINGGTAYQQTPLFPGLTPGIYSVRVSNSASGCTTSYSNNPVTLIGPACSEICDNDIDDDDDGLVDCEDFDCGPAGLVWVNSPSSVCPNSPFVLTLTGADANFDFELFKDNDANPIQTKSGTGDTLLFEVPSINSTTTFKVVAINKTDPDCEFDFSMQGKDIMVGIGDLVMLIDTLPESAFNEDGSISICLPGGVPPFILEYMPDNRGQSNPVQGPVNCVEYFKITGLKAGFYKVKVTDANGCSNEQVVFVDNPEKRRIGFPPSIMLTPNGDGYNDLLVFDGLFASPDKSELVVTNRYGSVVHQAMPYNNDWDAMYNGSPVPPDTYFYNLRVFEQEEIVYTGYITVVR